MLEENRGVLEREIHHLRTLVKDGDQQVARLTEDLNVNQQKLERSQDVQNRWKERSEALVEQLQAEQNRTILAEQAVTKYMAKIQAIKLHYQQVRVVSVEIEKAISQCVLIWSTAGTAIYTKATAVWLPTFCPPTAPGRNGSDRPEDDCPIEAFRRGTSQLSQSPDRNGQGSQHS